MLPTPLSQPRQKLTDIGEAERVGVEEGKARQVVGYPFRLFRKP